MEKNRTTFNSEDVKIKVWDKATKIKNKNPDKYRKDPYGKIIYFSNFNKNTEMGWTIDHIKPLNKGGSNDILNLQALQTKINISKADTLVKKSRHSKTNKK